MGTTVQYDGATIGTFSKGTKALATSARWMKDDIIITDTGMDADDSLYQDKNGFITVSDDYGTATHTEPLTITENGTYNAPTNTAYDSVTVAVPCDSFIESVIDKSVTEVSASDFSGATSVGAYSFYNCTDLESVALPNNITSIGDYAFYGCSKLSSVTLPKNITTLGGRYAFSRCTSLTNIDLSNITTLQPYSLELCGLTSIYMPNYKVAGSGYDIFNCTALVNLSMPNLATGNLSYFARYCSSLVNVVLPSFVGVVNSNAFRDCTSLKKFDSNPSTINNNNNFDSTALDTIILRNNSSICNLNGINSFNNTPFASGGSGGTLYVPEALIETYQSATNWSTILGYENNQILPIEGSQYEHYYADGTPIE